MQIDLQVLSINYKAYASRRSRREKRPLAPIKFNGVWTPIPSAYLKTRILGSSEIIWSGEIPCPSADSEIFTALASAKLGAVPQAMGCFPCTIHRIQRAGNDVWIVGVWAGSSTDAPRNAALAPWHHCTDSFTTPSCRSSHCGLQSMGMGSLAFLEVSWA